MPCIQLYQKAAFHTLQIYSHWWMRKGTGQRHFRHIPSKVWVMWKGASLSGWAWALQAWETWICKLLNKEQSLCSLCFYSLFNSGSGLLGPLLWDGRGGVEKGGETVHPCGSQPCGTPTWTNGLTLDAELPLAATWGRNSGLAFGSTRDPAAPLSELA